MLSRHTLELLGKAIAKDLDERMTEEWMSTELIEFVSRLEEINDAMVTKRRETAH